MATKKLNYTERDFIGLKNELIRLTKTYYPDLIQDTSDASIYSLFLDLNAAIADNLHYNIDRTLQETVLQYAQQRSSLYNIARTYGLKIPGNRPSLALCDLSIIVPVNGDKEDFRYLGFLRKGSQVQGAGQTYELANDCDFSSPYSIDGTPNRTKVPNFNANGIIQNYTITKREVFINGVTKIFKKEITDGIAAPFYKLFLPERNVLGVTSVIEKEGVGFTTLPTDLEFINHSATRWYEVDALAENEIFIADPALPADEPGLKIGKYIATDQRFVTEYTPEGFYFLTFGSGNNSSQSLLNEFSKYGVTLNLNKFMNNISLGNAVRGNSTLFIQYRIGGGKVSNVGAGAINSIGTVDFIVSGPVPSVNGSVSNSLTVKNVTAAIGGADLMTTEEIRNYITFNFAAQNRAVTIKDYISRIQMMPAMFGSAAKVGVTEVENKVKIQILSYTPQGKLTSRVSNSLKQNITEYLSNYRMLNDYIEISSAKVIDLKVEVDLIIDSSGNQSQIVSNVIEKISDYFSTDKMEMGRQLNISQLSSDITTQPGVTNVTDMRIFNKTGSEYSNSQISQPYSDPTTQQIMLTNDTIFFQPDEIPQIRFPNKDIVVRVKQPFTPNFS